MMEEFTELNEQGSKEQTAPQQEMDPTASPFLYRKFEIVTGGRHPAVDRLAIILWCFGEMNAAEARCTLAYLNAGAGKLGQETT